MSVIIKGMELPKWGDTFNFEVIFGYGKMAIIDSTGENDPILFDVSEVPTPHGRLIDEDELMKYELPATLFPKGREENIDVWTHAVAIGNIMGAETIIEAEEEK